MRAGTVNIMVYDMPCILRCRCPHVRARRSSDRRIDILRALSCQHTKIFTNTTTTIDTTLQLQLFQGVLLYCTLDCCYWYCDYYCEKHYFSYNYNYDYYHLRYSFTLLWTHISPISQSCGHTKDLGIRNSEKTKWNDGILRSTFMAKIEIKQENTWRKQLDKIIVRFYRAARIINENWYFV